MKAKYIGKSVGIEGLTHGKIYEIIGVEYGMLRVIDDSDEDYLYAMGYKESKDSKEMQGVWEIVEDNEQKDLENAMKMHGIEVKRATEIKKEESDPILNKFKKLKRPENVVDDRLWSVQSMSEMMFAYAQEIVKGNSIEVDAEKKKMLQQNAIVMGLLINLVDDKYKEEAKSLATEGKLDLDFIVNPGTRTISNRLKKFIENRKKKDEVQKEGEER